MSASTPATYTVTYTTTGTCPNSSTQSVIINALSNAGFNYSASSYCVNSADPTPAISGQAGGSFSSTPGLNINANTGTIDVSASTPATYTVTYTTIGTCPNSATQLFSIVALDDATFNYSSAVFCTYDSNPTPIITGLNGGMFSGTPSSININVNTGVIDLSTSPPGTYSITYLTNGICPDSSSRSVIINLIDTSVTVSTLTLTSNVAGATYQWIDCNTMLFIAGEINQSFTATSNGSYSVIVTENGCSDTSGCHVILNDNINELNFLKTFIIFQNPSNGNVSIKFTKVFETVEIKITNVSGLVILTAKKEKVEKLDFELNVKSGIYFIDIFVNQSQRAVLKLLKE